jgi:hypothetical protein
MDDSFGFTNELPTIMNKNQLSSTIIEIPPSNDEDQHDNLTNATVIVDQLTSPLLAYTKDGQDARIEIEYLFQDCKHSRLMSRFLKALFLALFSRGGAGVLRSKTVILNTHNICTQKSHGIICLNTEYVAPFYKGEDFA